MSIYDFKAGDVVVVKGLLTKMTVSATRPNDNNVDTVWFDYNNVLRRDTFRPAMLQHVPTGEYEGIGYDA